MWTRTRRSLLVALAGAALLTTAAHADNKGGHRVRDDDHDAARDALERGEVLPLGEILDRVEGQLPGRILKVEFEREDGVWIYEFTVLRADGRREDVYVDAASAAILSRHDD